MPTAFATHTANLKALMASSRFEIPRFQRNYSWRVDHELDDFWNDLATNSKSESYFMGIMIVTENTEDAVLSIVDGQQRTISLSLLANAIRILALDAGKTLIARSMRDGVLYGPDYENDTYVPRLQLSADRDSEVFRRLIDSDEPESLNLDGTVWEAQMFLVAKLRADVQQASPRRLGEWASFLTEKIFLSVFVNQDVGSAYKVYEVVNARGKSLTPSEMIKAYIIGSVSSSKARDQVYARWAKLEDRFERADAVGQFTQFIRHALTLRHGYVIPRDLYQLVTKKYQDDEVTELLSFLESNLDLYMSLVEPAGTSDDLPSDFAKTATVIDLLGLSTVRPIFMAAAGLREANLVMAKLVGLIVPRIVVGTFGTGAIEARFAAAASLIYRTQDWQAALSELEPLRPDQDDFEEKVANRRLNRAILCVIRFSVIQSSVLPEIEGYLHYIRQNRLSDWPGFSDEDFDSIGRTVGNSILLETESRPYGTTSPYLVAEKFGPVIVEGEAVSSEELQVWDAEIARAKGSQIAQRAGEIWFE
ncbi:DUF262 domain-containing protein [Gordonia aichiensis]|uniref:GmrSD restriction endonucleases N-terminal domain-containing protein n=1 Tax=Gordonia aichiensis NBRC 108223 TaxID=1220583 RepID=L7KPE3_9ACTN|nr:DUF262 domain-containing protein [Gordonia aichiensis]GAC49568.1 hypothetical protein GOACH_15_00600 [Gordonia aichiensis NBRC 108223]